MRLVNILVGKDYEVGSQPPSGYLAWHEWAETQHKAGLRQKTCSRCGCGCFPQDIGTSFQYNAKNKKGETVELSGINCLKCAGLNEVKNEHSI